MTCFSTENVKTSTSYNKKEVKVLEHSTEEVKCEWCNKELDAPFVKEGWVCDECAEGATTELVIEKRSTDKE